MEIHWNKFTPHHELQLVIETHLSLVVQKVDSAPGKGEGGGGGGGGVLGLMFAGYVPLASQNPYPI